MWPKWFPELASCRYDTTSGKVGGHGRAGIHIQRPLKHSSTLLNIHLTSSHFFTLERFTVILYHKVSTQLAVDEARRELFCKNRRIFLPLRMPFSNMQGELSFRQTFGPPVCRISNMGLDVSRRIVESQSEWHFLRLLGHATNLSGVDASPQEAAVLNASVLKLDYLVLTFQLHMWNLITP